MNDFIRFCVEVCIGACSICILVIALNHSGWFTYSERNHANGQFLYWWSNPNFEQAQVLFCGNSQVYVLNDSILEKVLEEPVFSLSCSSCDLEDLLNPLRSRIKKNQPKLIVLETHSLYKKIREKGVVKTRLPTTWANFFDVRSEWDQIKYLARDVIRNRSQIEVGPGWLAEAILRPQMQWKNGFRKSRFKPITGVELETYKNDWVPFPDSPIEQEVLIALQAFLMECNRQEIEVILYESPWFHAQCSPQKMRYRGIEQVAFESQVPFINMNKDNSLVENPLYFEATFENNQHLTELGANAVSQALSKAILLKSQIAQQRSELP